MGLGPHGLPKLNPLFHVKHATLALQVSMFRVRSVFHMKMVAVSCSSVKFKHGWLYVVCRVGCTWCAGSCTCVEAAQVALAS